MKKRIAIILSLAMMFGAASCGSKTEETASAEETASIEEVSAAETSGAPETEASAEIPNPWSDADDASAAASGAGVGYFVVPSDGTDTDIGPVSWDGFRYTDRLAEAYGYIGVCSVTIRKGLNQDTDDVSGDYNDYAYEWDLEADGWLVHCRGNVDGQAMLITWISDNFAYSISIRGQGDEYDSFGIDEYLVDSLVSQIQ